MLLDMALGSEAPTSFQLHRRVTAALLLIAFVTLTKSAPTTYDEIQAKRTDLAEYFNDPNGCYYNYQHYEEGDRIVTNEPCLNCTCHNRMLMCYLRVCPFSKAIGQDCTVQKSPDQCCPVISCPEVPVHLLTSSTTQTPSTTTVGWHDNYGCMMDEFFPDGAQVPTDPAKPCELCYCIRNRTACVMQECTLHVEGCRPVYQEGVCCPVRYDCDYENEKSTTSAPQITGGLVFSTTSAPFDCKVNDEVYSDGESIAMTSEKPCEHCYCMRGDIVCAVQDCGEPLRGKDCTPELPPAGQCCPTSYQCANETIDSDYVTTLQPVLLSDSDENEAEKFPTNEEAYDKLGEHHTSEHDDTNDVNSEHIYTTPPNSNEILPVRSPDQTNDIANKINEGNKPEISSVKPELTNNVNPIGTQTDQIKYESTDKPVGLTLVDEVQPTQSPSVDPSLNDNSFSPTIQTNSDENNNVKVNLEINDSESSTQKLSQDDRTTNLPFSSTESETQNSVVQDKQKDEIAQQTREPTVTESIFNEKHDPPKQNNDESTESTIEENKTPTGIQLNVDNEQTTQKLTQQDTEKTPLGVSDDEAVTSSNVEHDSPEKYNLEITQTPIENSSQTDSPSNVPTNDQSQKENSAPTEIPKKENEPTEQNKPLMENSLEAENQPQTPSTGQNQDSPQVDNASATEIPKVENEPTEENKPLVESSPQAENESEYQTTPSNVQDQGSIQMDNASPTEIPKVEKEPTEKNKPLVESSQQAENEPESQTTLLTEQDQGSPQVNNASPTEIPKVENEPTEENKPLVENSPQAENESESQTTPSNEQNQDSPQVNNASPTEIPKVENEPTEENKPLVESSPQAENESESQTTPSNEQNQYSPHVDNASPTEIPKVENEPTEENKPPVESSSQAENELESQTTPSNEQNQDSPQVDNASPTEIPKIENEPTEENKPLVESSSQAENELESQTTPSNEQNQDSPQVDNASPTDIPKVENEPIEENKPLVESSSQAENELESQTTPNEQNQDSPQVDNSSPTENPKVENEPTEENKPPVESSSQAENELESQTTPSNEQNQDSPQVDNSSPTENPKVENEPTEENKPPVESSSQAENELESQTTPSNEQNQDSPQVDNSSPTENPKVENKPLVESSPQAENEPESQSSPSTEQDQGNPQVDNTSPTEIPKVENEPPEENKPLVENNPQAENEPESQKPVIEQNQYSPQVENVIPTEIPSKLNEPQYENIVHENTSIKPVAPVVPENDAVTEPNQPIEDSNIFVMSPTSPPLSSGSQVKGEASTVDISENDNSDKYFSTEKNGDTIVEKPQPSTDDKTSSVENTIFDNNGSPISSTEKVPENNNALPQQNDENTEHSTETKPTESVVNGISNDVTSSPISTHEYAPASDNNSENSESAITPITEINNDILLEVTSQSSLAVDSSSQENQPINDTNEGDQIGSDADQVEDQNPSQTETPVETEVATNEYPTSVDEQANDVTTSSPLQQISDNNIAVQHESIDSKEPIKTQDETQTSNDSSDNNTPDKFPDSPGSTEISEVSKPSESPALDSNDNEQSVPTQTQEPNNEHESVTVHEPSQNVNDIMDQTSAHPSTSSDDKNTATELNQNNEENVTSLSYNTETGTSAPNLGEEPIKNTNEDVSVDNESTTFSQLGQIDQGSSVNADNLDNSVTTNSYVEVQSVVPTTYAPSSQSDENEVSSPVKPPQNIVTNVENDRPANVVPQEGVNSDEIATQQNVDDSSTNIPFQEYPIANVNNDIEANTNVPSNSEEIPNEVNQDSITESEISVTQPSTDQTVDLNKPPANDATMGVITNLTTNGSEINANEIAGEKPTETPQSADKTSVTNTPDYVIDITTISSNEPPIKVPDSIKTGDQVNTNNEITTLTIDKVSDTTTEMYENIQPGVPGEGSCLIDFVTYAHKAEVPKSNPCHEKCECLNSIVTCVSVNCPPAPPQHRNCIPLHPGNESWCCPTYMCEGGIEGVLFESNNQLSTSQLISTVVLEDKPDEENDEKTPVNTEVPSTFNPQNALEYNTLAPSQIDTSTSINSQDAIDVTEVSAQTETPNKQINDSAGMDVGNDAPVTTANIVTIENEKPIENDKPIENVQPSAAEKPIVSDQPSENESSDDSNKPVQSETAEDNVKPVESDQPINYSEGDVTTASYITDLQTNKPDTSNDIEEQNTLPNMVNESQDNLAPPPAEPNNESTNVPPVSDQNQPTPISELEDSVTATTYKPNESIAGQQVEEEGSKIEVAKPTINEESGKKPATDTTDLPESNGSPSEVTQTPTIFADEKPTLIDNNSNGLRPTSIDDIISSVNMVKDAVKNSLETSTKSAEVVYQTTSGAIEDYQPTVLPGESASFSSEDSLPEKYNEPQSTVSNVPAVKPELQTDNQKLSENPTTTESSADEAGATQIPNLSPSVNADQGLSTDSPSSVSADKGEFTDLPPSANADQGVSTDSPLSVNADQGESTDSASSANADQGESTDSPASVNIDKGESTDSPPSVNADQGVSTDSPPLENADKGVSTDSPTSVNADQGVSTDLPPSVSADKGESVEPPQSANGDQGASTDLPLYVPDKQKFPTSPSTSINADLTVNKPEESVDDKIPEATTTQYLPSNPTEQDSINNEPMPSSDSIVPQMNVESNTDVPEADANDKISEITTQVVPSLAHQGTLLTDDTVNKPLEDEKPETVNTESPVLSDSSVNADKPSVEVSTHTAISHSSTNSPIEYTSQNIDTRFSSRPTSSSVPTEATVTNDVNKTQESGNMVQIPFETEKPLSKPSSNTPYAPVYTPKPSYTPIPQSTWTQKPFHQDSTSEAPQPDQGFPDEYDDENEAVFGPGTCRYGGKIYVSAQQVPRDDPCDFCFCFRGDIICLQQSCPPPIFGCYQENIQGFCCPRYECPVAQATSVNVTTTTTTTTTSVPPHFLASAYRGAARRTGCLIHGHAYRVGEDVGIASGPCLECICGADGKMKCNPKPCSPEPLLRKMMAEAVDHRRR